MEKYIDIADIGLQSTTCALYSAMAETVKINRKYIENNAETQIDSGFTTVLLFVSFDRRM
jgi:hypothetical protein